LDGNVDEGKITLVAKNLSRDIIEYHAKIRDLMKHLKDCEVMTGVRYEFEGFESLLEKLGEFNLE
jgi:hypothetical protein